MLKRICNWKFWDKAIARAIRTLFQGIGGGLATVALLQEVRWDVIFASAMVPVLLSFTSSIVAGLPEITDEDFAEE